MPTLREHRWPLKYPAKEGCWERVVEAVEPVPTAQEKILLHSTYGFFAAAHSWIQICRHTERVEFDASPWGGGAVLVRAGRMAEYLVLVWPSEASPAPASAFAVER